MEFVGKTHGGQQIARPVRIDRERQLAANDRTERFHVEAAARIRPPLGSAPREPVPREIKRVLERLAQAQHGRRTRSAFRRGSRLAEVRKHSDRRLDDAVGNLGTG